jgi:hypothetical protein
MSQVSDNAKSNQNNNQIIQKTKKGPEIKSVTPNQKIANNIDNKNTESNPTDNQIKPSNKGKFKEIVENTKNTLYKSIINFLVSIISIWNDYLGGRISPKLQISSFSLEEKTKHIAQQPINTQ